MKSCSAQPKFQFVFLRHWNTRKIPGRCRECGALCYCCFLYCTSAMGMRRHPPGWAKPPFDIRPASTRRTEGRTLPKSIHKLWVLPCTRCAKSSALQQVWHFKHFHVNWADYKNLFPPLPRGNFSHVSYCATMLCLHQLPLRKDINQVYIQYLQNVKLINVSKQLDSVLIQWKMFLVPLISVKSWTAFADFSGTAASSAELDGIFVLLIHPRPLLYLQDALQAGRGALGGVDVH